MDKKRSLIAILLSLTITLTFMPVIAFADDADPDAQNEPVSALESETDRVEDEDGNVNNELNAASVDDEEVIPESGKGDAITASAVSADVERESVSAEGGVSAADISDDEYKVRENWNLFVQGVQVTKDNESDVLSNGTVSFDPEDNRLTLRNASIKISSHLDSHLYGIRYNSEYGSADRNYKKKFVIELIGHNTISGDAEAGNESFGIAVFTAQANGFEITGPGSLDIDINSGSGRKTYGIHNSTRSITISGADIDVNIKGSGTDIGIRSYYGMTFKDNASVKVAVGSGDGTYGVAAPSLDMNEGCVFIVKSEHVALQGECNLSDATKAQGVWVSTEADPKGCTLWDGTSKLSNYKFIHIPKDHDCMWDEGMLTRPATETEEGIMTFTCKICGKTKTEAIPKLAPKLKVFAAKAVAKGKRVVKISWNKADGAERYVIYGARCGKKLNKIKTVKASKQSYTKKSLKVRKNYKFRVVAQKMVDGKWTTIAKANTAHVIVGGSNKKYTNPKSLKVKPAKMTLSVGKSKSVKSVIRKVKGGKALLKHAKKLRYTSSNPAVATVSAKGKVEAVGTGSCTIYVQAVNGIWKTVSVTVN